MLLDLKETRYNSMEEQSGVRGCWKQFSELSHIKAFVRDAITIRQYLDSREPLCVCVTLKEVVVHV